MQRRNNESMVALALITLALFILVMTVFFLNKKVFGSEELMVCDDCQKTIQLDYDDGVVNAVHLIYEWPD